MECNLLKCEAYFCFFFLLSHPSLLYSSGCREGPKVGEAPNKQPGAWKQGQGERWETRRICTLYKGIVKFIVKVNRVLLQFCTTQPALEAITLLRSNRYHNTDLSNRIQKLVTISSKKHGCFVLQCFQRHRSHRVYTLITTFIWKYRSMVCPHCWVLIFQLS